MAREPQTVGPAHDHPLEPALLALVSALVIALQIVFIRSLSIASHHHFVYLVVSTALLGFGASGTLLAVLGERADAHYARISHIALLGFSLSASWALRVSGSIPIDLYYMLYDLREAARLWLATLVLAVPFFAGGLYIGLVLRRYRAVAGRIYAANLAGSGLGALGVLPLLGLLDPEPIAAILGTAVALAAVVRAARPATTQRLPGVIPATCALALIVSASALVLPWEPPVDQYKALAFARQLEEQGDAVRLGSARSPVARSDVYDAPSMHYTLFASPGSPQPPAQLQVFRDGSLSGALFRIGRPEEAPILRWLPQSLAYAGLTAPRVLILGETTGVSVWLALLNGATHVTVVHRDPELVELLADEFAGRGGEVFSDPRVTVLAAEPRSALSILEGRFDLIHIADTEGSPAASAGLLSLQEDYLLTTEAIGLAMERLRPGGMISATRGLQSPPRDNLRIFMLFVEAARRSGVAEPGDHLVQARNYLAATTILARDRLTDARIGELVHAARQITMDVDYFPGITAADLTRTNLVEGPSDGAGSYLFHAAISAVRGEADDFAADWVYNVSPPSDDRPYFHNFFRLSGIRRYVATYGQLWFSRMELGPVVVAATLVQAVIAGTLLIVVPGVLARRRRTQRSATGWTISHFTMIGLGFMGLEMLFIQKSTLLLGDPVYSTAAVITAILVWAGLGSAVQERLPTDARIRIRVASVAVVILAVVTVIAIDAAATRIVALPHAGRFAAVIALLGPISFSMGWLFPAGVARVSELDGEVGLALAANGVASVVAAPLAVLVSSSAGFSVLLIGALTCYAVVALATFLVPGRLPARPRAVTSDAIDTDQG